MPPGGCAHGGLPRVQLENPRGTLQWYRHRTQALRFAVSPAPTPPWLRTWNRNTSRCPMTQDRPGDVAGRQCNCHHRHQLRHGEGAGRSRHEGSLPRFKRLWLQQRSGRRATATASRGEQWPHQHPELAGERSVSSGWHLLLQGGQPDLPRDGERRRQPRMVRLRGRNPRGQHGARPDRSFLPPWRPN